LQINEKVAGLFQGFNKGITKGQSPFVATHKIFLGAAAHFQGKRAPKNKKGEGIISFTLI
jgi:hypothetical protein